MFERTTVMAKFVGSNVNRGFVDVVQLFFKVPSCKSIKMIQCIGEDNPYRKNFAEGLLFIQSHNIGDKVELIKVGKGKYAGYELV